MQEQIEAEPVCVEPGEHETLFNEAMGAGDTDRGMTLLLCGMWHDDNNAWALDFAGHIFEYLGKTRLAKHFFERAEAEAEAHREAPLDEQDGADVSSFVMPDWLKPYETAPDLRPRVQELAARPGCLNGCYTSARTLLGGC